MKNKIVGFKKKLKKKKKKEEEEETVQPFNVDCYSERLKKNPG